MADPRKATDGPSTSSAAAFDVHNLPDWDNDFYDEAGILAFASALSAPENLTASPSEEDLSNPQLKKPNAEFITALNDWRPVRQRQIRRPGVAVVGGRKSKTKRRPRRGTDETREGWTYSLIKYPLLFFVFGWITFLGICYLFTRFYIHLYEQYVTWRGTRDKLRKALRVQENYEDWTKAAEALDSHLGNDKWKIDDEGSYYDWKTLRKIIKELRCVSVRHYLTDRIKSSDNSTGSCVQKLWTRKSITEDAQK